MGFQEQQSGDIHATLAISQEEARFGSSRVVNLADGRTATVTVPVGTFNGQELRLVGQGSLNSAGVLAGDLILRVSIVASPGDDGEDYATEGAMYTSPSELGMPGSPGSEQRPGRIVPTVPASETSFNSMPTDVGSGAPSLSLPPASQSNSPGYTQPAAPPPQAYPDYKGPQSNPGYGQPAAAPPPQAYPDYKGPQSNPAYGQPAALPPQAYPDYSKGPQGAQVTAPNYNQQTRPRRNRLVVVLILVIVIVVIVGSGLAFYLGYYQSNQAHTSATQTAQTQVAATARVAATGTAGIVQGTANAAATSTAQIQGTALAYQSIYTNATRRTPVLDDPLSSPSLTSLWAVTLSSSSGGSCTFTGGSYHSTISNTGFFQPCYALNTNYSNFAFQVNMTIVKGNLGGVLFRANSAHDRFYLFRAGTDGSFALYSYANTRGSQAVLLLNGSSPGLKGLNQSNEITLIAQRSTMYFYLNRQYVGSVNNGAYSTGQIGVFAESSTNPTDVAFSHAKVWTL